MGVTGRVVILSVGTSARATIRQAATSSSDFNIEIYDCKFGMDYSPLVEKHIGAVIAVLAPEQLLKHVFVHHLDVHVVELHPPVLDLYYRNVVSMLVSLSDMHDYAVQPIQIRLAFVVVVLW